MSKIGDVLVTVPLSFTPSGVMWSGDGQSLFADGIGIHVALNASTGEERWSWSGQSGGIRSPDERTMAFAHQGRRKPIEEFEGPWDCNELPASLQKECERHNREDVGWHVVGHKELPGRVSVHSLESGAELWGRSFPAGEVIQHPRYSPDGKLLAVSGNRTLLFDSASGELRIELDSHPSSMSPTAFSSDSQRLATADSTRLALIDVTAGGLKWATSLPARVTQFAFAKDDSMLVVSTERQHLTLSAEDGSIVTSVELQVPLPGGHSAVLSPDGRLLAMVVAGEMALWDVADGRRCFETPVGDFAEVRFNPVLPEIAIASATGVKVVNSRFGATVWQQATDSLELNGLAFSTDGLRLALYGKSGQGSGFVQVHSMSPTSVSHRACSGPVAKIALSASPDPLAVVASHTPEAEASVFRAETGDLVLEKAHPGVINALTLSRDGRHFATGGSDGGARLFTTLTGDKQWQVAHNAPVNALTFLASDGGDDVITVAGDRAARRLAHDTGQERWKFSHPHAVTLVAASPDGPFVATACADRSTRLLNAVTGKEIFSFPHDGKIRAIAFNSTGSMLAAGGDDGAVLIIDTASGRVLAKSVHTRVVTAAAFSPDGELLATAGKDHAVQLFDVSADPPKLASRRISTQTITKLVFHPTEPQLALVNDEPNPAVTIVDPAEGTELSRFSHPARVNDLTYSLDGLLLATACEDTLARIYPGRREP
ncbi:WD40 repeat domain-containing protein [Streptomyces sp. MUM 178J]|uniref:WD40 repeat domain-containing protein n=1 Tax=Streptomyces sp. MUM 178J TaxID=2791991 RepID=UPI001F046F3C|nr:WD40 repeat domain-containing protein [Streptomyces sp. MUM 178J]WRQ81951.1 WD40 repeat domain-containing protein [Streptomyces sp. MUM 178J]